MSEVRFPTKPVNRFKFIQVGSLSKLESKPLNDRSRRLEVNIGSLNIQTKRRIVGDVFLECNGSPFFQGNAPGCLAFEVRNCNGDIAALLLEPLDLIDDHRMAEVHLATRHEPCEDTKAVASPLCLKHRIQLSVSKNNATSVKARRGINPHIVHRR